MLKIVDRKYYEDVVMQAAKLGVIEALDEVIGYCDKYGGKDELGKDRYQFILLPDRRMSFNFIVRKNDQDEEMVINGGVIYYGPYEDGISAPQFSVSLATKHELSSARWEVHS